jgi:hypothetical protein
MASQPSLFSPTETAATPTATANPQRAASNPLLGEMAALRVRDEAIGRVERNAAAGFNDAALEAVRQVAKLFAEFTTDEAIAALGKSASTHDGRAWGAVMVRAQKQGLIAPTDRFRNTNRVSRHHAPIRIWKSLIGETK